MFLAALVLGVVLGWLLTWILQDRLNKSMQEQNERLERDLASAQRELADLKAAAAGAAQAPAIEADTAADVAEEAVTEEADIVEVDTAAVIADDGDPAQSAVVVEESSVEAVPDAVNNLAAEEEVAEIEETVHRLAAEAPLDEQIAIDRQAISDLTQIRGIGPKYAETLHAAGYTTIAELATASPDQLRDAMPPETHNLAHFEDWIDQANELTKE